MVMKKFINKPENLTRELLEGLVLANEDMIELSDSNLVINKKLENENRVTIVTLGGTGHEPALSGFVGQGMIDIFAAGEVFVAPGPQACIEAIELADKGKGVLFVVLNHLGDMLTADLTIKQIKKRGLNVVRINTQEDISNAPRQHGEGRRGLVGCVPLYKVAGAAASQGKPLEEIAKIAQYFADNMATVAIALKGSTHPVTGLEISKLEDYEMEIGMGQHGEGGGGRMKMMSADETAEIMLNKLLEDLDIIAGEKLMLIINGSGSTTLMELLIVFRKCAKILKDRGIELVANYVGELLTTQETAGFQMFIARMNDELLSYWNAPCNTPYFKK